MFQKSIAQEFEFISLNENSYSKPKPFDAFVWKEGKKLKIIKGRDIDNPEDFALAKTLLNFNPQNIPLRGSEYFVNLMNSFDFLMGTSKSTIF